jgi:DNA-directed RNA polymerase I and III subunit RPAC1
MIVTFLRRNILIILEISLVEPVIGEDAKALREMCPMNVFDIEDIVSTSAKSSKKSTQTVTPTAKVARPRDCTMCRECIRRPGWFVVT